MCGRKLRCTNDFLPRTNLSPMTIFIVFQLNCYTFYGRRYRRTDLVKYTFLWSIDYLSQASNRYCNQWWFCWCVSSTSWKCCVFRLDLNDVVNFILGINLFCVNWNMFQFDLLVWYSWMLEVKFYYMRIGIMNDLIKRNMIDLNICIWKKKITRWSNLSEKLL